MKIQKAEPDDFTIQVSREELRLLNNAVNEVCNGIDSWEFSTRLGSKREEALALLSEIGRALS